MKIWFVLSMNIHPRSTGSSAPWSLTSTCRLMEHPASHWVRCDHCGQWGKRALEGSAATIKGWLVSSVSLYMMCFTSHPFLVRTNHMAPLQHKHLLCWGLSTVLGMELEIQHVLTKLFNEKQHLLTDVVKTPGFLLRSTLGKGLYPQQHR